jgi:hypothetical protein
VRAQDDLARDRPGSGVHTDVQEGNKEIQFFMTRRFHLLTVGAVALSTAALLAGTTMGVRAQTGPLSDVLSINGTAPITNDTTTSTGMVCADPPGLPDPVASVDLMGGCGQFSFSGTATGASDCDPGQAGCTGVEGPGTSTITAKGDFHNTVCGTGDASGTFNVTSGIDVGESGSFTITFAGGQGTLTGTLVDTTVIPNDVDTLNGTVTLAAGNAGDDAQDCISTFTIAANVVAREFTGA